MDRTKIVRAALFTPMGKGQWGAPLILRGKPGVAKTAVVEQIAASVGLPIEVFAVGERGEGALGVVPVPGQVYLRYPMPEWAENLADGGVLFVDEINLAPPALQGPLMGLCQAKRIGGGRLPGSVRVIGAMNPTEMAAGGWDLAPPLANRFGHLDWPAPSADDWADWLIGHAQDDETAVVEPAEEIEERVLTAWPVEFAKAAGLVAAFLRKRPELLHQMPEIGSDKIAAEWASCRTWEYATRALASSAIHSLSDAETETFMTAYVGLGPTGEFLKWRRAQDLPDPADLLDGRTAFAHAPARLDRTAAMLQACAALVTSPNCARRDDRVRAFWRLLGDLQGVAIDLCVPVVQILQRARLDLPYSDVSDDVLIAMAPALRAAGMAGR